MDAKTTEQPGQTCRKAIALAWRVRAEAWAEAERAHKEARAKIGQAHEEACAQAKQAYLEAIAEANAPGVVAAYVWPVEEKP